jgi:hypothetical protein
VGREASFIVFVACAFRFQVSAGVKGMGWFGFVMRAFGDGDGKVNGKWEGDACTV